MTEQERGKERKKEEDKGERQSERYRGEIGEGETWRKGERERAHDSEWEMANV